MPLAHRVSHCPKIFYHCPCMTNSSSARASQPGGMFYNYYILILQQALTWCRQLDFSSVVPQVRPTCVCNESSVREKFSEAEYPSLPVSANFPNCTRGPQAKHFVQGRNYIWPQTCSTETFKDIGSTLIKLITNGA